MNRYYIADALDKAITTVAEQEFDRLTKGLIDILQNLKDLDSLGSELRYQQGQPDESGLTSSPSRVDAPTL